MPARPTREVRRVVVLSPTASVTAPTTAGGILLTRIVDSHLATGAEVAVFAPWTRAAETDLDRTSPSAPTHLLGRPRDRTGPLRVLLTVTHRLSSRLLRCDPLLPWPPLVVDLLLHGPARRLLREADVLDLQWEEYARLGPLLRRLAPRAAIVSTFHDVISQRAERETARAGDSRTARLARRSTVRARRIERRALSQLDAVFVLSEKDRDLLRAAGDVSRVHIVPPPLVEPGTPLASVAERPPVVGFVSFLRRHENRDAAFRLAEQIWPRIRTSVPGARLLVIGGGVEEAPERRLLASDGVELTGYVDDLEEAYSLLRVTISPLDRGAGVKFKVVESLVRGIPTLTTTVGAEGIDPALLTTVSDDDDALADAAIRALTEGGIAEEAVDAAHRARENYGVERFAETYQSAIEASLRQRGPHIR